MSNKKKKKDLYERILLIKKAQLKALRILRDKEIQKLPALNERVAAILQIEKQYQENKNKMIFFVMYDIENNRVRHEIAKFLIRQGCIRIQKSVYLALATHQTYEYIHKTLTQVQQMYDNNDSILVIPVSTDIIKAMKIIGKDINIDLITGNRNTLFF